jgi:RND family efflux transporter MFP subunit
VAKVETMRLQDDAQAVGTLRSRQGVMMRPEVAGRVAAINFQDGGRVRRGQLLVQLDDVLQRAEVKQSQASVSIAQSNLRRNQELVAQNFIAQRVVDESAAALQVAEAQLALSCARLERMQVLAPFDGSVGIRSVNVGDYVKDGADLVNVEDISSLFVDFRVPERFLGKLRREQTVDLNIDAFPSRIFKAKVEAIDPLVDANGRSIGVRAVLPNTFGEPAPLPPGAPGRPPGAGGPPPGAGAAPGQGGASPSAAKSAPGQPPAKVAPRPAASSPAGSATMSVAPLRPMSPELAQCQALTRGSGASPGAGGMGAAIGAPGRPTGPGGPTASPAAGAPQAVAASAAGARGGPPPGVSKAVPGGPPGAGSGGPPFPLRPGMFARATVVFGVKDEALVVPEESIVPQGGRQFVVKVVPIETFLASLPKDSTYTLPPNLPPEIKNLSQRTEVRLGLRRAGKVEVLDGVGLDDTVVAAGHQRLQRDGTPLRIVDLGRRPTGGPGGPPGAGAPAAGAMGGAPGAAGPVGAAPGAPGAAPGTPSPGGPPAGAPASPRP